MAIVKIFYIGILRRYYDDIVISYAGPIVFRCYLFFNRATFNYSSHNLSLAPLTNMNYICIIYLELFKIK